MKALKSCPACGGTSLRRAYTHRLVFDPSYPHFGAAQNNCLLRDVLYTDAAVRHLDRCGDCGLYFQNPAYTAEELGRLYGSARMSDHYRLVKTTAPAPSANIETPEHIWEAEAAHSRFIFESVPP